MAQKTDSASKSSLINAICSYFKNHSDVIAVYLFGSFRESNNFSDIDLGIFMEKTPAQVLDYELRMENKLEKIIKIPLDIRILNIAPLSFCYNVIQNKQLLIDRNPNKRAEFESLVIRQYLDFAPFRIRYLREVSNAPI